MSGASEKSFQQQVLQLAHLTGWLCYHTHDSPFGLLRKRERHVRAAAEPLPYGLRLVQGPVHPVIPPALVGEVIAMPAQEVFPRPVEDGHPPAAHLPVHYSRADEPRPLSSEVARSPVERHGFLHILPFSA